MFKHLMLAAALVVLMAATGLPALGGLTVAAGVAAVAWATDRDEE